MEQSSLEKWLGKRLNKKELLHLIVWILEQPEGQGDTDMWIDNSVRDNAQKQEELRVIRGARIGGWHPVCDVCDAIAQKLDDIVVCQ